MEQPVTKIVINMIINHLNASQYQPETVGHGEIGVGPLLKREMLCTVYSLASNILLRTYHQLGQDSAPILLMVATKCRMQIPFQEVPGLLRKQPTSAYGMPSDRTLPSRIRNTRIGGSFYWQVAFGPRPLYGVMIYSRFSSSVQASSIMLNKLFIVRSGTFQPKIDDNSTLKFIIFFCLSVMGYSLERHREWKWARKNSCCQVI